MQGTVYKRVRHQCNLAKPRWVRLPNPTPKTFKCPTCGGNLMREKLARYDCSWWAGGKKRSKTFQRKHDAARFLATVVTETHNGTYQETRGVSMSVVFDEWEQSLAVKHQQGRLKPSTRDAYHSMVNRHLRPAFETCRSDKLTVNVIQEWERRCAASLAAGTMTPKYYNNLLGALRVILLWARGRGQRYLTHNPLEELKPAYVPKTEARFLEPQELAALLDAAEGQRDQTILYLTAYSGLRRGEVFGLQWSDLDETRNRLSVKRSNYQGELTRPKTAHSEKPIDLPEPIVARLRAYREQYPPMGKGFLFRTETGEALNPDVWSKRVFVPTATRAGLRAVKGAEEQENSGQVGMHTLRHTYASILINAGENIKYISRQLRHASVAFTLDRYGHLFEETGVGAMERLSQLIHISRTPFIHQNHQTVKEQRGTRSAMTC